MKKMEDSSRTILSSHPNKADTACRRIPRRTNTKIIIRTTRLLIAIIVAIAITTAGAFTLPATPRHASTSTTHHVDRGVAHFRAHTTPSLRQHHHRPTGAAASVTLFSTAAGAAADGRGPSVNAQVPYKPDPLDVTAMIKYVVGYVGQWASLWAVLKGADVVLSLASNKFGMVPKVLPLWMNTIGFYIFNILTSKFSWLPNQRTDLRKAQQESWTYNEKVAPKWTPPGWVFGIMWPLYVFGLRATTAAMVVRITGQYACPAILSLMAHLCFGSLWNTINNVERRLGVSVLALYGLWITNGVAAIMFGRVLPKAGILLGLTQVWITAAAALETQTWRLNPDVVSTTLEGGDDDDDDDTSTSTTKKNRLLEPLLPRQNPKWSTKFRWEKES